MLGLGKITRAVFGSANDRQVKAMRPAVAKINALEPHYEPMSDDELKAQTGLLKQRLADGETLDKILPDAFAVVREAAKRVLGQRHYDVQLTGGIVLHRGEIAEMRTGEGKTLVATLPVYLNALSGKGVHVVTVNDYLASRDAGWMGRVYRFLGLSVGVIHNGLSDDERRAAYGADITYGTNNEFGFDYLRDNMKYALEQMVQRPFHYAIVDEVDSILIDEARTPLIISGPTEDKSDLYVLVNDVVKDFLPEHYELDEKQRSVILTEDGTEHAEKLLGEVGVLASDNLYDFENTQIVHHLNQALRANVVFKRDTDYIVRDGKVVIIDEFTGRMMDGRRWSDGLHQAVEAKEGVDIQPENQTLASITFQNYFRMYPKLAGMTGTAATEAQEFYDIYRLNVVEIPTNVPVARKDEDDDFFRTAMEKFKAIAKTIAEARERGQPVLVGTVSIEKSELLSEFLRKENVPHTVLNARFHEREAHIVAQAGRKGAVTIATNMAGRGTDIQLGGNAQFRLTDEHPDVSDPDEQARILERLESEVEAERAAVLAAGGLFVLGTERHESRRIDNQLRGRSGRQGDPGLSHFFLSLEDDLLRIFGQQNLLTRVMNSSLEEGEAIKHPWISKAIEKAQQKVEARNYEIRKQLLQYDDVMNDQRKVIYEQRRDVMDADTVTDVVKDMRAETVNMLAAAACPAGSYPEQWDIPGLKAEVLRVFNLDLPFEDWVSEDAVDIDMLVERIGTAADLQVDEKIGTLGADMWARVEKSLLLQSIDHHWKEHLATLDALRQVIHLRAYAQRNPLNEYKSEAFGLFELMLGKVREEVSRLTAQVQFQAPQPVQQPDMDGLQTTHIDPLTGENDALPAAAGGRPPRIDPAGVFGAVMAPTLAVDLTDEEVAAARAMAEAFGPAFDPADVATWERTVPRNHACPCGSERKFKHCHGKV